MGGIGRAVARRCAALGMVVAAVRRHPGRARPRGGGGLGGPGELADLARRSDGLGLAAAPTAGARGVGGAGGVAGRPRGG